MAQKTILVITDGIGYNPSDKFNAFSMAKKPSFEWLFKNSSNTLISTSGLAVGLPDGQMGNSEVGHMTIGSGRVLYQNLVKISLGFENGSFAKDEKLLNLFKKCKNIHVIGLYSDGGVHSLDSHFDAMCELAQQNECEVFAHVITDGRDVAPASAAKFIRNLESKFSIATICGRFYAMDRDKRWERVLKAYETLSDGVNPSELSPSEYIDKSYANGVVDEFIIPASFNKFSGISVDDGVIFINFRNDRMRELVAAFGETKFDGFKRDKIYKNIITMTEYDASFSHPVLVAKQSLKNTLSEVIADAGLRQLHTAETEKYAHVTFFFNGGMEELVTNETRVLVPSPKVQTYDECPQMSAVAVCEAVLKGIDDGQDFIVVNFANGDMVGHTGNFNAAVSAVEAVDMALGQIIKKAQENGYAYVQISDHGNCEAMCDESGAILTNHTNFDVFCFVLADGVNELKSGMGLSNVAASVLKIMGLEIPVEMNEPLF
ncbi:2,3-bisphosphoglycerate-independent phosphoglycerate mutase [Campylobacter sp. faydin G-140]|uniref:2,3-bisphosphoglycerate-independent phosphoglycerate mutase n=1 Tax=Campylobacter anatolicus TaxID=2829105 RepID=UPI001B972E38|nr:2,3-bisphosphoglycerate-independent phosphoglycerate mutase [Campylobacter anatolicus]MBR8465257.1 2,3-bisphosphoglycerate-independent phosphoglycerate mutase [Campylobacter anatolicus]